MPREPFLQSLERLVVCAMRGQRREIHSFDAPPLSSRRALEKQPEPPLKRVTARSRSPSSSAAAPRLYHHDPAKRLLPSRLGELSCLLVETRATHDSRVPPSPESPRQMSGQISVSGLPDSRAISSALPGISSWRTRSLARYANIAPAVNPHPLRGSLAPAVPRQIQPTGVRRWDDPYTTRRASSGR